MGRKRVWVQKIGSSPTLVRVAEDDLVDDLRDAILRKYNNSLGRVFDSPDLVIKLIPRQPRTRSNGDAAATHSNSTSTGNASGNSNGTTAATTNAAVVRPPNPNDCVLQPDEPIWAAIERFYPDGQTVEDALIIDVPPQRRTPRPSPRHAYYSSEELPARPVDVGEEYFPPMGSQSSATSN
ncbi:ssk1 response regulator receiver, partial [Ascosphaera acerosa]